MAFLYMQMQKPIYTIFSIGCSICVKGITVLKVFNLLVHIIHFCYSSLNFNKTRYTSI